MFIVTVPRGLPCGDAWRAVETGIPGRSWRS
jgi:hypothetical protein